MKNNRFMKPAFLQASALVLACALALAACTNPAGGGNEAETPRGTQYTITFDSGMKVQPVTGDEGSKIDKPEDPVLKGYTFLGWYAEPEGGELFTAWPHTLAGDLTLYAQWHDNAEGSIELYTIIFDSAGGTEVSEIEAFVGSLIGKPADPALDGFSFLGWFGEAEGGEAYAWPLELTGDLTLYAHWLDKYTLSFDSAGGTEISPLTAGDGAGIDKPEDPTREGYTFLGWYTEPEGGELFADWPLELAGDLTLYARWHDNAEGSLEWYTIIFDSAGGTEVSEIEAFVGSLIGKPADPALEGFSFLGWFGEAEGGEAFSWPLELTGDLNLHAQWHDNRAASIPEYTIAFDSRGGSAVAAVKAASGTSIQQPSDPAREGYSFQGWYSETEGGEFYEWPHTLSGDLTLYARWTGISYTVEYDGNGGTGSTASTGHMYGTESPLAENGFVRVGSYIFEGWNTQTDGGGVNYSAGQSITDLTSEAGGKVTLYARWTDTTVPTYTISFDSNGGSAVDGITVNEGEAPGQPVEPTWKGYTFQGWFDAAEGGELYEWSRALTGDITIYARWTLVSYTITYTLNGGTNAAGNPASYTVEESAAITLAAPACAGYTFGGWYGNANLTGSAVTSIPQKSTGDKSFWAKWTSISYTITYNLNGGTNAAGNQGAYTVESAAISLQAPARAGYTFGGWYGNANLTGSAVTSIPQNSTGDKSFWAKWTPASYTITYNLNGGTSTAGNPASYTVESAAITLTDPLRGNYNFDGWFDNADLVGDAITSIPAGSAGDKSFWAKWTAVYSVIYNANGGSGSVASSVHALNEENVLAANGFTLPGYVFAGWNTARDGSGTLYRAGRGVSDLASSAGAEVTLYARWLPVEQTIELDDNPTRGWGHNAAGALLWQFFPERKEFVVFAGQDYKSKADSTVYVTGRSTENRIRVLPGRSLNTWAEVPDYSISQAYSHTQWNGVADGYVLGQIIPRPRLLGNVVNAHQIRIIFVNAEIDMGENSRYPLDIGPYHTFWEDGSWEGDFYQSLGWDLLNDHEIYASIEFEGENKLYSPSSTGIILWDSRALGAAYNNEIPWQPHSNSWTSWKTKNNLPHWVEYVKKCLDFARKWGYPFDYSPQDGSIENGPGVVGHRFQSFGWGPSVLDVTFRGSFTVSNVFLSDEEVSGSGPYVIIPAEGNAWTQRATTE